MQKERSTKNMEYENTMRCLSTGKTLIVFLEGDIDHHNARPIRSRIDTKVYIQRPDELIIDLSHVAFMDSSGLGLILGRYTKAMELGIDFKVQNPTPQIKRILDLAGSERLIKIESSVTARRAVN
jgi:stage II sporulation protein AA (anti-sigma F factor antagonist)